MIHSQCKCPVGVGWIPQSDYNGLQIFAILSHKILLDVIGLL